MRQRRGSRLSGGAVVGHLGVMAAVSAILGLLVAGLVVPFAGVVSVATEDVAQNMDNLPEELETEDLAQKTRILDKDGNQIASIYDENRINVPLKQMSRTMVEAIVSIEDYRFYQHGALDLKGTLRAFITNQASGGVVQGGSSITQQLVKLTLVDQAQSKEEIEEATTGDYARKLRELRYAIALEEKYSKDWILERYLNIAYFGDGAYGIQSAARHYFGVNAKDLNLRQSALLAGLVKNPTGYDPTNNPERALARRNTVLDRMAQLGVIGENRAEKVAGRRLGLDVEREPNGCQQSQAPFFCDYVVNWLMHDPQLGQTRKERKRMIRSGGLTIHTTIDLDYQKAADEAVRASVAPTDQAIGGLAMVEPGTGQVRALAQSRPMGKDKSKGQTYLNYVVPKKYGDSNGFQAGSTFKVFVLAAAINQGIPLSTSISSPQQISIPMSEYPDCEGNFASTDVWEPENSTGAGTYDLYSGTQDSVNTFYAQLEKQTGLCEPFELAKSMGVTLEDPASQRVPSFVLGVTDTNPVEMAEAYATFAARGLHCAATPVSAIDDAAGQRVKDYTPACQQVMPGAVADAVSDVLRGVMEGGFGSALALDKPSAGKTGTINDNMAVWFAGYTPTMASVAMVAGANEFGQPITLNGQSLNGRYIASAFGSTVAGPIWGSAMNAISDSLEYEDFSPVPGDEVAGVLTGVPDVSGMSVEEARATLTGAGFQVRESQADSADVPAGSVVFTSPAVGTSLSSGDTVTVYASTGTAPQQGRGRGRGGDGDEGDDSDDG